MTASGVLLGADDDGATTLAGLAAQQNTLLAQIHAARLSDGSPGLAVYRANAQASARRALEAAYPVISQLIGEENFAYLARDFWQAHPPIRGDLAQWGEPLAAYMAQAPQLTGLAFLPDVARIEWALHVCAGAADGIQDASSFATLAERDPGAVCSAWHRAPARWPALTLPPPSHWPTKARAVWMPRSNC